MKQTVQFYNLSLMRRSFGMFSEVGLLVGNVETAYKSYQLRTQKIKQSPFIDGCWNFSSCFELASDSVVGSWRTMGTFLGIGISVFCYLFQTKRSFFHTILLYGSKRLEPFSATFSPDRCN